MIEQRTFALWGGEAEVTTDAEAIDQAVVLTREVIDAVDRTCSTFRDDSDITRVNAGAGNWVDVDPLFTEILTAALDMAAATDGAMDPTVGPLTQQDVHLHRADWRQVRVAAGRVRIPDHLRLTLDACAKAWCADRAAQTAAEATGTGVLVGLCGDVATAGPAPADGWHILCLDDHRAAAQELPGESVCIRQGAVATSSTTVRRHNGRSHIIDPTTMRPALGPWRTVSVAAANCLQANAAATASLVMGSRAPGWLQTHNMPARLVAHNGTVRTTGGWP